MAADFMPLDYDEDGYDLMMEELQSYNEEAAAYYELTWQDRFELFQSCCTDVLMQSVQSARFVVFAAFACHLVSAFIRLILKNHNNKSTSGSSSCWIDVFALISHILLGLGAVWVHFESHLPVLSLASEAIIFYLIHRSITNDNLLLRNCLCIGFIVGFTCLLEFVLFPSELWHSIRGCHMILAMKLISLMETPNPPNAGVEEVTPNFLSFLAYCCSPATVIYGPWISFSAFITSVTTASFGTLSWLLHIVKNAFYGVLCLLISTCALNGIFFTDEDLPRHLIAVRDSYSFILSNFFISYLSTVIATIGGMTCVTLELATKQPFIVVSEPFNVFVPHSLTALVVAWSIPMHTWLRRYVFRPIHRYCGPLAGVLATYTASALLHGFNAQIAIVLLSVGVFTYVEFNLRARLAKTFDACIASRPCEDNERGDNVCHHAYDLDHPFVRSVNVAFSCYAVALFCYATACFGNDSEHGEQTVGYSFLHLIATWSQLHWFGHTACLAAFVFDRVTR